MTIEINSIEEMCALMRDNKLPDRYIQHNYVRCLRCGKLLKSAEARSLGYGPVCYKKAMQEGSQQLF